jgi:predicted DNA-binding transcriptional regulator YafY
MLVQKHGLNDRQSRAVHFLMQNKKLTIQDYEALCPEVNRRTLQRDLKAMIDMELLVSEGSTNQLAYRMKV